MTEPARSYYIPARHFNREMAGHWSMNVTMKADLVAAALEMALSRRKLQTGLLHHSDRGSQYACAAYPSLLARHGIHCSMSRVGNCYDNAMNESFWSTLKREAIGEHAFETIEEARATVFEYIEVFYNASASKRAGLSSYGPPVMLQTRGPACR